MSKETPLAADLLHGACEIAAYLGISERQCYYAVEAGNIPVKRMGRLIVASKSVLRRAFIPEDKIAS
jgi:hypothetical protein